MLMMVPPSAMAKAICLTGPDGHVLRIACDAATCRVVQQMQDGRIRTVETPPGGPTNFELLALKYRKIGFK